MIDESRHGEAQAESGCEFVDVNTLKKNQQPDVYVARSIRRKPFTG